MSNDNNLPSLPRGTKPVSISRFKLIEMLYESAHAMELSEARLDAIHAMPYEDRPKGDQSWQAVFDLYCEHGRRNADCRSAMAEEEQFGLATFMFYSNQGFPLR